MRRDGPLKHVRRKDITPTGVVIIAGIIFIMVIKGVPIGSSDQRLISALTGIAIVFEVYIFTKSFPLFELSL